MFLVKITMYIDKTVLYTIITRGAEAYCGDGKAILLSPIIIYGEIL